jgi:hypothetical protein
MIEQQREDGLSAVHAMASRPAKHSEKVDQLQIDCSRHSHYDLKLQAFVLHCQKLTGHCWAGVEMHKILIDQKARSIRALR